MIERNIIGSGEGGEIGMIRDDQGNFDTELAIRLAEEEIVKTMADLRHHDKDSRFLGGGEDIEHHRVGIGNGLEGILKLLEFNGSILFGEMHAQEESFRGGIAELRRVHYVQVQINEEFGHGVYNTGPIGAREGEDVVRHDVEGDN